MYPAGWYHRHQAVKHARIRRRRQLVVLRIRVLAVTHGLAESAAGLRQHLEAFAVELGFRWMSQRNVKEDYFFNADGTASAIDQLTFAKWAAPSPYQLNLFCGVRAIDGDNSPRGFDEAIDLV